MATQVFDIQAIGFDQAAKHLGIVGMRLRNARPAWELIEEILEAGEERVFRAARGRYVDTGALKDSLTQGSANAAIRDAHADSYDFGSGLYYARFQKDKRGKSAVLKLTPTTKKASAKTLLEYVTEAFGGGVTA